MGCGSGCGAYIKKDAAYNYAQSNYEKAMALYEQKKYQKSLKELDNIVKMNGIDTPFLPDAIYFKAVIYVEMASQIKNPINYDLILGQFREKKLEDGYNKLYNLAIFNLGTILTRFTQDKVVPKTLLLLGQVYDHDGLRLYEKAKNTYKLLIASFPNSKESELAEKRLSELENIYKGIEGTPHDIMNLIQ
jgi:tetratricopeptide (TPR) repeat protein